MKEFLDLGILRLKAPVKKALVLHLLKSHKYLVVDDDRVISSLSFLNGLDHK